MKNTRLKLSFNKPIIYGNVLLIYFLLHILHSDLMSIDNTIHKLQIMLNTESESQDSYPSQILDSSSLELQRSKRDIHFENKVDSPVKDVTDFEIVTISSTISTTKQRKNRDYCKAAHIIGASPRPDFGENNLIGPWFNYEGVSLKRCRTIIQLLGARKESIKMRVSGLYLVYAQVTYLLTQDTSVNSSVKKNSYTVELVSRTNNTTIMHCFHSESPATGESSCYTATVYSLNAGDRLHIKQHELNRPILMSPENTFFGLVLLRKQKDNYQKKKPSKSSKS